MSMPVWRSSARRQIMRAVRSRYLLIFVVLSLALDVGAEQTLITDGFEGAFGPDGIAAGWQDNSYTNWGTKDISFARETEHAHSGVACQRMTLHRMGYVSPARTGWSDMGAVQLIAAQRPSLQKGAVYRVRAWLRASGPMGVTVQLRQATSPWKPYIWQTVIVDGSWRLVEYLGTAPVDDPAALFMIRFTDLGTVWIDDLSLEALSDADLAGLTPPPATGNLLRNGTFDLDRANWLGDVGWDHLADPQFVIEAERGDPCLRASLADGERFSIVSDVVAITPGRPIRISCRMRAQQPTDVTFGAHLMHAEHAMWPYCMTRARVGASWQTLETSGVAARVPGIEHAFVRFVIDGPGPVWVDDVELRQDGGAASVPLARAAIISDRHPFGLYHDGDSPMLRLLSTVPDSVPVPELSWRVVNFWGETVLAGKWVPGAGRGEQRVSAASLPRGWYRGEITWDQGGAQCRNECTFCILPPRERYGDLERCPFGAHFQVGPAHLGLARSVGARWMRLWPPGFTLWERVEPEKGKWTFYDKFIHKLAQEEGLGLCGMLESPPRWARGDAPDYWQDWEAYVAAVVERYKDSIRMWEVENEPSLRWWRSRPEGPSRADAHIEVLRHSYALIKRLAPQATVVGGCVAGDFAAKTDGLEFGKELIAGGALNLMDALSFHYYHSYNVSLPLDEEPDPILDSVPRFKGLMRASGREMPIINTEGGVYNPAPCLTYRPCAPDNYAPLSPELVARLLVRMYVSQMAAGVDRFFYYDFFISGSPVAKAWDSFVEGDGQPRPAVAAYAVMTWLLDGAGFTRADRPTADAWVYRFATPRGELAVVWSRTGTACELSLPGAVCSWDMMGREMPVRGELQVTPAPTYVLLGG